MKGLAEKKLEREEELLETHRRHLEENEARLEEEREEAQKRREEEEAAWSDCYFCGRRFRTATAEVKPIDKIWPADRKSIGQACPACYERKIQPTERYWNQNEATKFIVQYFTNHCSRCDKQFASHVTQIWESVLHFESTKQCKQIRRNCELQKNNFDLFWDSSWSTEGLINETKRIIGKKVEVLVRASTGAYQLNELIPVVVHCNPQLLEFAYEKLDQLKKEEEAQINKARADSAKKAEEWKKKQALAEEQKEADYQQELASYQNRKNWRIVKYLIFGGIIGLVPAFVLGGVVAIIFSAGNGNFVFWVVLIVSIILCGLLGTVQPSGEYPPHRKN